MTEKLKPCPFCGSDRITVWNIRDGREAVCKDCKATGAPAFNGTDGPHGAWVEACKSWNTRADAAFMEEVREVLEGFCPPKLAEIESLLWDGIDDSAHGTMTVTCGQMRRARALLAKIEGK